MTDELERLRVQLRDTRKKPVAGDFWQAVEEYEQAVRRDERAAMPCYMKQQGSWCICTEWNALDDGTLPLSEHFIPTELCPSCAARAERDGGAG